MQHKEGNIRVHKTIGWFILKETEGDDRLNLMHQKKGQPEGETQIRMITKCQAKDVT